MDEVFIYYKKHTEFPKLKFNASKKQLVYNEIYPPIIEK